MKEYFKVAYNLDTQVSGTYPQCAYFVKGISPYNEEQFYDFLKYYNAPEESFPPVMPELNGYRLHGWAKFTDFLSHVTSEMLLADQKALSLLKEFNIGNYRIIPTNIYSRKKYHPYFFIYIVCNFFKYLKIEECEFKIEKFGYPYFIDDKPVDVAPKLKSWEEYKEWKDGIRSHDWDFPRPAKIVLSNGCPKDLDVIRLPFFLREHFFSKELKDAIERENISGLRFEELPKIIIED